MKPMKHLKKIFAALIMIIGIFSLGSNTYASPPVCDINSNEPYDAIIQGNDGNLIIQGCSGLGRTTWNSVLASARLSPKQSSTKVVSYDKNGGNNQALSDFNKMPGNTQQAGDGVLLKKYEGATLTYYPSATSTGTPSLQYPSSTSGRDWDKVRYYD